MRLSGSARSSEAIQVKGAIALARISRDGMRFDVDQLGSRQGPVLQEQVDELVAELEAEPAATASCVATATAGLVLTAEGAGPEPEPEPAPGAARGGRRRVAGDTGRPVPIPRTDKGKVSLVGRRLGGPRPAPPVRPGLDRAGQGDQVAPVLRQARRGRSSTRTTRRWSAPAGRAARAPTSRICPARGASARRSSPRPGHLFLIVDYSFIELRTLAAVCEARYGRSRLADVIRAGIDPHCYTAAMFEGMELDDVHGAQVERDRRETGNGTTRSGSGPRSSTSASRAAWGRGRWSPTPGRPTGSR